MSAAEHLSSNLLRLAKVYSLRIPQTLATVSRVMARDSGLFGRLAADPAAGFTPRKYDETVQRFSNYWPEDLAWPEGITRPPQTEKLVQMTWGKPRAERAQRAEG